MPSNRFYFEGSLVRFEEGALEGNASNHLNYVLRRKREERIEIINGMGFLATAKVLKVEKSKTTFRVLEVTYKAPSVPPLNLVQALPKLSRLELIVQKGTELGVTRFHLFPSKQSETRSLSPHQMKRLEKISIEAMKQCGRLDLPKIEWRACMDQLNLPKGNAYFGEPTAIQTLPRGSSPYLLFIGPEKGFTHLEKETLEKRFHAQGVKLHPHTLRVETAAIAAITLTFQTV